MIFVMLCPNPDSFLGTGGGEVSCACGDVVWQQLLRVQCGALLKNPWKICFSGMEGPFGGMENIGRFPAGMNMGRMSGRHWLPVNPAGFPGRDPSFQKPLLSFMGITWGFSS